MKESNRKIRAKIYKVAQEARKFVLNSDEMKKLYGHPQPHLSGWCGYSSLVLAHYLNEAGFPSSLVSGYGHWFVKTGDFLVDITASQFGQEQIVVRNYDAVQEKINSLAVNAQYWRQASIGTARVVGLDAFAIQMRKSLKIPNFLIERCRNCGHTENAS